MTHKYSKEAPFDFKGQISRSDFKIRGEMHILSGENDIFQILMVSHNFVVTLRTGMLLR